MRIRFLPHKFNGIKVHAKLSIEVDRLASHQWINLSRTTSINMKTAIVVCVLSVAIMALARPDETHYTDRYDNINLDEILSNDRVLDSYVNCVLDQGKCTPEAKELKQHIVEAMENDCEKCTDAQRKGTRRVIGHLINKKEETWTQLTAKYDPEHKYAAKYEKDLKEIKA